MISDPYATLELDPTASPDEVKRAYRRLAKRFHPDRNPDNPEAEAQFKAIASAFETLSDPERRREHDRHHGTHPRSTLPPDFLNDMANAIERAQTYIERMVLPHYARYHRGAGAEAAARMIRDLDELANVSHLTGARPTLFHRIRASQQTRRIGVSMQTFSASSVSMLVRGQGNRWEIVVTPWALYNAGFAEPSDLDDAVIRILLTRYAQILAAGKVSPPTDPEDWDRAIQAAAELDQTHRMQAMGQWAFYAVVAAVASLLVYAGYAGW